jgi:hypothetical protein
MQINRYDGLYQVVEFWLEKMQGFNFCRYLSFPLPSHLSVISPPLSSSPPSLLHLISPPPFISLFLTAMSNLHTDFGLNDCQASHHSWSHAQTPNLRNNTNLRRNARKPPRRCARVRTYVNLWIAQ